MSPALIAYRVSSRRSRRPSFCSRFARWLTDLGLIAERIEIAATSRWNGRVLGETRMRTETGASVVAVLRRAEAIPSPTPDFRLAGGDTLIVVGTREGVDGAAAILGRE